jgi:hypothetical protein
MYNDDLKYTLITNDKLNKENVTNQNRISPDELSLERMKSRKKKR